jgi:excisionase family DNA binding protein
MADQSIDSSQVHDVRSFAERHNVTDKTVRHWVERGLIPYRRIGRRIFFVQAEVDEFFSRLPGVSVDEALRNYKTRYGR